MKTTLTLLCLLATVATSNAANRRQPYDPVFSPDGNWIAYTEREYPEKGISASISEIWVVKKDGSSLRRLTSGSDNDGNASWSPDGKLIAFERNGDLYTIQPDGAGLKNITNTKNVIETSAEWTKSGDGLLLLRDELVEIGDKWHETGNKLVLRNLASGKDRVVLENEFGIEQVVRAPDRNDLAYLVCFKLDKDGKAIDDGKYEKNIVAVNLQTGQLRPVFAFDEKSERGLEKIRCANGAFLVTSSNTEFGDDDVAILRGGNPQFLNDLPALAGDITPDGKTVVSPDIIDINLDNKWSLILYDVDGQKKSRQIETCISDPNHVKAKDPFAQGNVLYDAKKYAEAITAFSEAIRLNPNYIGAYFNRAYCNLALEKPQEAITDYDNIIRLKKTDADAHMNRGEAYESLGDFEKASNDYQSAAIFGRNPQAYRKYAAMLRKKGLEELAVRAEKNAAKLEEEAAAKK